MCKSLNTLHRRMLCAISLIEVGPVLLEIFKFPKSTFSISLSFTIGKGQGTNLIFLRLRWAKKGKVSSNKGVSKARKHVNVLLFYLVFFWKLYADKYENWENIQVMFMESFKRIKGTIRSLFNVYQNPNLQIDSFTLKKTNKNT